MESAERLQARQKIQELREQFLQKGDIAGMFDAVYEQASGDTERIPWAHLEPSRLFVEWQQRTGLKGEGKRALQVGCGLGDDAEELARLGFETTAFDISAKAIAWCRQRFPDSRVHYEVADLLNPPQEWRGAFDFALEIYTLQALPRNVLARAIESLASLIAPGGSLLVICRGSDVQEPEKLPRPLTRAELAQFQQHGLQEVAFEDFLDQEEPVRRFRVHYRRL